ncbi:hypothetical protein PGTUg99_031165 [Puccinia graminis f. sp. tritici]|uniref:Uncharacterized protein n=1 Tax=Puccinia graminis f. sp. tritici TaxID=56615 RepID=A0A5B0Q9D3_PUCGR|nr:hypothetical protein PGTUg99_031165 [Puccinia graminis f. sp. tritici]
MWSHEAILNQEEQRFLVQNVLERRYGKAGRQWWKLPSKILSRPTPQRSISLSEYLLTSRQQQLRIYNLQDYKKIAQAAPGPGCLETGTVALLKLKTDKPNESNKRRPS